VDVADRDQRGAPHGPVGWAVGAGAFAVEVALAIGAGVAGHRAVDGEVLGYVAAALCVTALVAVWATFMSPKAPRRLGRSPRIVLGDSLVIVVAVALALTGATAFAWVLAIAGVVVTTIAQATAPR
jgi:hypothetical protein